MKIRTLVFSMCTLAAQVVLSPLAMPADPADAKVSAKDVSKKADDAARAVGKYTIQQRDEAIKSAKSALDDVDARIRALDRKVDREWDQMDQAARKKARAAQAALRKERDEVAEWYGGLKHSSAESWEDVKSGFVSSYQRLKASFAKAGKDL
jgi:replication fork clamp-binding protein CrfC